MKAVILAAGEGTRLNKGWTIVPKPLIEIGDRTIIEHVILRLKEAGLTDIIIVVGFMSEHIKDYLRDGTNIGVKIKYVYNQNYKDNLLISLLKVKEKVQGPFVLCMADLFFEQTTTISNFLKNINSEEHYVCIDQKINESRRIEEKVKIKTALGFVQEASKELSEFNAIDCGLYLLQEKIFLVAEKCLINNQTTLLSFVMSEIATQGRFKIHNIGRDKIIDIDREKDVEYIQLNCLKRIGNGRK